MKRIKLLPSILMLILCVGVLAIGVYAASPITGTIEGTINITAAQGVKIAVYRGANATAENLIDSAFGSASVELNAGGSTLDASAVIKPEDVTAQIYTLVLSTNQATNYVVDTETIQVVDGVGATSGEKVSGAAVITKLHKPTENTTDTNGNACFTKDKPYTIQISVKCGKVLTEAINVGYSIDMSIYTETEYQTAGKSGVNGVDYLYFGEYPQAEADVTGLTLTADGTFKAYDEDATISSDIDEDRPVYTDGTHRYVLYNSKYYLISPLKWRILNQASDGKTMLMCDTIIEQVEYQKFYSGNYAVIDGVISDTIYANNYEYSTLRKFMNNIFLNSAFSSSEQVIIKETTVDNSDASMMDGIDTNNYSCEDTNDKVFALSYAESVNTDYGFDVAGYSNTRKLVPTAYSTAMGTYVDHSTGIGVWHLRSPHNTVALGSLGGSHLGSSSGMGPVYDDSCGCVPAMNIAL